MKIFLKGFIFAIFVVEISSFSYGLNKKKNNGVLVKVSAVFRHGDRTAIKFSYPKDPYASLEIPEGQLTLRGKSTVMKLGLKLRRLYNEFLGSSYVPCTVEALSSSVPRSVESLRNMSESLFPTIKQGQFEYTVIPTKEDDLINVYNSCRYLRTSILLPESEADGDFFKLMSEILGTKIVSYNQFLGLCDYVEVMAENGYAVPDIIKPLWGQMLDVNEKGWKLLFEKYKKEIAGNLLNKIAKDSIILKDEDKETCAKRLHLYSGHDINVGALLALLGVFEQVNYGSYVAFEVYKINDEHFVEAYYDCNGGKGRTQVKIPGCGAQCPINQFVKFAKEFYLGDDWCPKIAKVYKINAET